MFCGQIEYNKNYVPVVQPDWSVSKSLVSFEGQYFVSEFAISLMV